MSSERQMALSPGWGISGSAGAGDEGPLTQRRDPASVQGPEAARVHDGHVYMMAVCGC